VTDKSAPSVLGPLLKDSLGYLVGSVGAGLASFLLLPLYTRFLTLPEMGILALLEILIIVFLPVAGMGMQVSYLKWFVEVEPREHGGLLFSTFAVSTGMSVGIGALLVVLGPPLLGEALAAKGTRLFWLVALLLLCGNLQNFLGTHLRARRRPWTFSSLAILRVLVLCGVSFWCVAIRGMGVEGALIGRLAGDAAAVAVFVVIAHREFEVRFLGKVVKDMARYGWPVMASSLAALFMDGLCRNLLAWQSSLAQVGLLAVGLKVSAVVQLALVQPFGIAWGGLMFQIAQSPDARTTYAEILLHVLVVGLLATLGVALLAPLLFMVFATPAYLPGVAAMPALLLVQVCVVVQYPATIGLYLASRTKLLIPIAGAGVLVAAGVCAVAIPAHGVYGAAGGLLAGWVVTLVLEIVATQRLYPLPIRWRPLAVSLAAFLAALALGRWLAPGHAARDVAVQLAIAGVATACYGAWALRHLGSARIAVMLSSLRRRGVDNQSENR
jgi:O-antigen/teichoic acid export membrane protein